MMSTFGYTNAFGVYQDFYTRSHVASASRTSWIGSTQLFLLTATGLFAGKLVDLGYFRQTVLAGSFIYVFSCVLFLAPSANIQIPLCPSCPPHDSKFLYTCQFVSIHIHLLQQGVPTWKRVS